MNDFDRTGSASAATALSRSSPNIKTHWRSLLVAFVVSFAVAGISDGVAAVTYTRAAAMAKWVATENACKVIDMALQMHGGMGVLVGQPLEALYRDIRALRIYEGASEVQQLIIGKSLLKSMV